MNYWENPEAFEKRNKEIVKDKQNMTILELSKKYNLSGTRILRIVQRHKQNINFRRAE